MLQQALRNLAAKSRAKAKGATLLRKPAIQDLESRQLMTGDVRVIYSANMDEDPSWTLDPGWEWGPASGQFGNPESGNTDSNVVGYDLDGEYENSMRTTRYATMGPIGTVGYTNVSLRFHRWLGIESSNYDQAIIQVSHDGQIWNDVWRHTGGTLTENEWTFHEYDVSSVADDRDEVYIRWGIGPTDGSVTYAGWNIDDVSLTGRAALPDLSGLEIGADTNVGQLAGSTMDVSFNIQNQGGDSDAFHVTFYLSQDASIETFDEFLGFQEIEGVSRGSNSGTLYSTLTFPGAESEFWDSAIDAYYIGMIIDSELAVDEIDESNNRNVGEGIDLLRIDAATGDFDFDGVVSSSDVDMICNAIFSGDDSSRFDLNGDQMIDGLDLRYLLSNVLGSDFGDSNVDGVFDTADLVFVFQAGEYEDGIAGNSTWSDGDWNCDGDFDSGDLVLAFLAGSFGNNATIDSMGDSATRGSSTGTPATQIQR